MTAQIRGSQSADEVEDGRRARRDRNRDAVVDALLELYAEGNLTPGTDEVAARAGLSSRSLFRYFADVDDLTRAAISRQYERLRPVVDLNVSLDAPGLERVEALADQRVRLYEAIGQTGVVSRMRAPMHPMIAAELRQARAMLRSQIRWVMERELSGMQPVDAADALAAADVVCSFESYRLLRDDLQLPTDAARRVMVTALIAIFRQERLAGSWPPHSSPSSDRSGHEGPTNA